MLRVRSLKFVLLGLAIVGLLALLTWRSPQQQARADSPTGFISEPVIQDLEGATDFAFAPDGRIFIALRSGEVLVYDDAGAFVGTFIDLPNVNDQYFRGLLGLELDPGFATNGYVYLYYVTENNPALPQAPKTARLMRVTADGDVAMPGSELVLLGSDGGDAAHPSCLSMPAGADCLPADGGDHFGGGLRFAPDGKLFLSTGDAFANRTEVQHLNKLAGKVLRVNPDGTGPSDNPFFTGDPAANASKVWAYGFRNPFRLAVQPSTGLPFVGDVGSFFWEEINLAGPGLNFGWPCYEGTAPHIFQFTMPVCIALLGADTPTEHPLYYYANPFLSGGAAVALGAFYTGTTYPSDYAGSLFFGDFMARTVKTLRLNPDNSLAQEVPETILTGADSPVAFRVGPDGNVYYVTQGFLTGIGNLQRIRYEPGDRAPVAKASANPTGGLGPLTVQFSSAGSYDPEGTDLSHHWNFGDGAVSDDENPSHQYTIDGAYNVTLTVEDGEGQAAVATTRVVVGNRHPRAFIDSPASGFSYAPAQTIALAGHGSDPETGTLPGESLLWKVTLQHCTTFLGGCHSHLFHQARGASTTVIAPDQGYELFFLEITLTATDSAGLSTSTSITIGPDSDGDRLLDQDELWLYGTDRLSADTDGDGCQDGREVTGDSARGGMRDPLDPWDFFDTPDENGNMDGTVNLLSDFFEVVFRFGATDDTAPGLDRSSSPRVPPPGAPAYHPGFDRSEPNNGDYPWKLGAPDGTIDLFGDIFGIVYQFGHDCS